MLTREDFNQAKTVQPNVSKYPLPTHEFRVDDWERVTLDRLNHMGGEFVLVVDNHGEWRTEMHIVDTNRNRLTDKSGVSWPLSDTVLLNQRIDVYRYKGDEIPEEPCDIDESAFKNLLFEEG